jgi:hypothetical protein
MKTERAVFASHYLQTDGFVPSFYSSSSAFWLSPVGSAAAQQVHLVCADVGYSHSGLMD